MAGDFESDAMKIGAETARQPKKIGGLDGPGWVEEVRRKPMATLPPGAAHLMVEWFDEAIGYAGRLAVAMDLAARIRDIS